MQTKNPLFDDIAEMMTSAAGALASAGEEVRTMARSRMDRVVSDMDLVSREEFEVVRDMAVAAREEVAQLKKELAALKKAKAAPARKTKPKTGTKSTTPRKKS